MPGSCAIILPDNTIAGVIMASPLEPIPLGYAAGAVLVQAPPGCNEKWKYDPVAGFSAPTNKVALPLE